MLEWFTFDFSLCLLVVLVSIIEILRGNCSMILLFYSIKILYLLTDKYETLSLSPGRGVWNFYTVKFIPSLWSADKSHVKIFGVEVSVTVGCYFAVLCKFITYIRINVRGKLLQK